MRAPARARQKRARPQPPSHTKRLSCFFWLRGSSRWSGFTCTGAADAGSRSGASSMAVVVEGVAMMTDMGEYSTLAAAGFVHLLARWTASGKDCGAPWRCHCDGVQHFILTLCRAPVERSSARTAFTARCLSMGVCPSNPAETTRTRISRPSARRARPSRTPSSACPSVTSVTARWCTGASAARNALPIASSSSCICSSVLKSRCAACRRLGAWMGVQAGGKQRDFNPYRSPRQSGAAGPCSTLRGCTARPDRRIRTAVSSSDRAESLGF